MSTLGPAAKVLKASLGAALVAASLGAGAGVADADVNVSIPGVPFTPVNGTVSLPGVSGVFSLPGIFTAGLNVQLGSIGFGINLGTGVYPPNGGGGNVTIALPAISLVFPPINIQIGQPQSPPPGVQGWRSPGPGEAAPGGSVMGWRSPGQLPLRLASAEKSGCPVAGEWRERPAKHDVLPADVDHAVEPGQIIIPAIHIDTDIQRKPTEVLSQPFRIGADYAAFGVPEDIRSATWWEDGPLLGGAGMAVVTGYATNWADRDETYDPKRDTSRNLLHVAADDNRDANNNTRGNGVFDDLHRLIKGDQIHVQTENGAEQINFAVTEVARNISDSDFTSLSRSLTQHSANSRIALIRTPPCDGYPPLCPEIAPENRQFCYGTADEMREDYGEGYLVVYGERI